MFGRMKGSKQTCPSNLEISTMSSPLPRIILPFLLLTSFAGSFWGQATISQPYGTVEEYVQNILLGEGVTATNITYTGGISQLGFLENGSSVFSVDAGLMLNTDNAMCADFCTDCLGDGNDPDLLSVANSVPPLIGQSFSVSSVNDLCVIEFDFEAGGDSISFNYVFGSDEYLTWVNSSYNDIFAFFLSGPGISGPFAAPAGFPDGAINIAQVPDSDPLLPITISSVNNVTNSQYYVNNPSQQGICINGYTTTFTAEAAVQCGQTYHIKLAIADGTDNALESFVLLEAGSFSSNAVNLEADAVPFAAGGIAQLVDYQDALGLPNVVSYPNGESFPLAAWIANNEMTVTVDGETTTIDAVIIEGCNDARFTVIRPEVESELLDTLYLGLEGSAVSGLDFSANFSQVIMQPGQVESEITLGVVDDGANEGVETVLITYEYINGCGELITTTSQVVIMDPIPIVATPSVVGCQGLDGTQELGYDNISGYGPFNYNWNGNVWSNATEDPGDWTVTFDSVFVMTDASGHLIPGHIIPLQITDQCGKSVIHDIEVLYPVMFETEICTNDRQDFPAYNAGIPISDVRYNGNSLVNGSVNGVPLTVDANAVGDNWSLEALVSSGYQWADTLTLVDTCGYETRAFVRVRECFIPNVFTPDNTTGNNNFRVRGLDGFYGSRLLIYNRYGTLVFEDETTDIEQFEIVWDGTYLNGNEAPEGVYQWVLLRSDGHKEHGDLSLFRQR